MRSLTLREAALRAERSVKTVRRWITDLDLPAERVGRGYLVRPADLTHFIRANQLTPGRKRVEIAGDVELRSRVLFAAEWNARQEAWRRQAAADLVTAIGRAQNDRSRLAAWLQGGRAEPSAPNVRLVVDAFERFISSPDAEFKLSADHLGKLRDVHRLRLADVPYPEIARRVSIHEDYAKQLEREWQRLYGPAPEGWREHDQSYIEGPATPEGPIGYSVTLRTPTAELATPRPRTAAEKAAGTAAYKAIAKGAAKAGRPFRPADQRATKTSGGGSRKR